MSNTKQTAVSWLIDQINSRKCWADPKQLEPLIEQAKQMEKEQIETAWCEGNESEPKEVTMDFAKKYYTQTYEN